MKFALANKSRFWVTQLTRDTPFAASAVQKYVFISGNDTIAKTNLQWPLKGSHGLLRNDPNKKMHMPVLD